MFENKKCILEFLIVYTLWIKSCLRVKWGARIHVFIRSFATCFVQSHDRFPN